MSERSVLFGLGGLLRKASIRNKLWIGFLPCLVLLWITAGYGLYALFEIRKDIDNFSGLSDDIAIIADLQADIYSLRLEVNKFVRTGDSGLHELIESHFTEMESALKVADEVINDPGRAKKIDEVQATIGDYETAFKKISELAGSLKTDVETNIDAPVETATEAFQALQADLISADRAEDVGRVSAFLGTLLVVHHDLAQYIWEKDDKLISDSRAKMETLVADVTAFADRMRSDSGKAAVAAIADQLTTLQGAMANIKQYIEERERQAADQLDTVGPKVAILISDVLHSVDEDRRKGDAATDEEINRAWLVSIILVAIATFFTGLLITGITAEVAGPINRIADAMYALANGEKDVSIPGLSRTDESGRLAQAAQTFKENAEEIERMNREEREREIVEKAEDEAREREEKMRMEYLANEAQQFGSNVGDIVEILNESADEMKATAKSLSQATDAAREESNQVVAACTQANANVDTMAASAEELSVNVAEVGKQMVEASEITNEASRQTQQANKLMDVLGQSAEEIDGVIQLIDRIVNQTQLLSLNATIEANRAGEAGRGFTVVAYEIKNLSEQTRTATQEIRQKVKNIQNNATDSIESIRSISTVFRRVEEIVSSISSAMTEQDAATGEIARNALEAANGTREAAESVAQLAEQISSVGDSAKVVLDASDELGSQSKELRSSVRNFIQTITTDQEKTMCAVPPPR